MHPECTLESIPKPENASTCIYAVTQDPAIHTTTMQTPWNAFSPIDQPSITALKHRSKWLHWPALLTYALCIALLSGAIGGFLGGNLRTKRLHAQEPARAATAAGSAVVLRCAVGAAFW
jgi:hypothetical protein